MQQNMLSVRNVTRKFSEDKEFRGIDDITFSVYQSEILCVLGKSGSGKSTLLRVLAGLEIPDSGEIVIGEKIKVGYVAQDFTLWPHLTVLENIVLAPKLKGNCSGNEAIIKEATGLLYRFGLGDYVNDYPNKLSGGQRQRVALLRAVMMKPQVLLLDEITTSLDPELIKSVLDLIRALAKEGYAMVIVTHHLSFALSIADKVLFMKDGRIIQNKKSIDFFSDQTDPEIKSFIVDIAKKDDSIEIFKGREQFQAYHLGLIKRLPEKSIIHVAGAVGDAWYVPMEEFYSLYEELRIKKKIVWKMVTYNQGVIDCRLVKTFPDLNQFRKMPRTIQNPANYNVFGDTVITQIFEDEPTIIQIKNKHIANAYLRFFEELWNISS